MELFHTFLDPRLWSSVGECEMAFTRLNSQNNTKSMPRHHGHMSSLYYTNEFDVMGIYVLPCFVSRLKKKTVNERLP